MGIGMGKKGGSQAPPLGEARSKVHSYVISGRAHTVGGQRWIMRGGRGGWWTPLRSSVHRSPDVPTVPALFGM